MPIVSVRENENNACTREVWYKVCCNKMNYFKGNKGTSLREG